MRRCHRPAGDFATEWYSSASALPADWDTDLPEGHFLQRQSLMVHESINLPDVGVRYAALRSRGAMLARAAFQILRARPEHVKEEVLPTWQYRAWRLFTRTIKPKLLVGGQLFRHDVASLQWSETLSAFEAFSWYRSAIEEAAQHAHAAAVLLKDLPDVLAPHFLHAAAEYLLLRNDISMHLAIPAGWDGMKDYEGSLKHKYAQRFRKVRQSWASLRIAEMDVDEVAAASSQIFGLYQQVTEHQPVRLGLLSEDFIPALKAAYSDTLKVWGIWDGETMIAFASGWVNEASFDMFYIGFDYAHNATLNLYFNILFFAIEQAILFRKPQLILGRTALEAKARVGCRPLYLNTFLYVRNGLLRSIVTRLQARLGEGGNEWEQRHPFKA